MKTKGRRFARYVSLLTAILVIASLVAVAAPTPVAANVSQPTVSLSTTLGNTTAQYTVGFTITSSLAAGAGNTIVVDFDDNTTVPAYGADTYASGSITLQGADVAHGDIAVSTDGTKKVTITTASAISAGTAVTVIFKTTAGIKNPVASGDYTLKVNTSAETTQVSSATFTISNVPTVGTISPNKGNVGDIMWVEVAGSEFTGSTTTDVSTTTLSFGTGATVLASKYIANNEIDAQIQITSAGTLTVTATTAAGTSTTNGTFTANAANTRQVDIWNTYNTSATSWDTATLSFQEYKSTVKEAVAAATDNDILIAHAATYATGETFPINIDKPLTLKSDKGSASTTIDNTGTAFTTTLRVTAASVTIGGASSGFTLIGHTQAAGVIWADATGGNALTVKGNSFQVAGAGESRGIWADSLSGGALIDSNTFASASAWTTNSVQGAPGTGILVADTGANNPNATISNNTVSNVKYTFLTFKPVSYSESSPQDRPLAGAGDISNVKIFSNEVSGLREAAIRFATAADSTLNPAKEDLDLTGTIWIYKNSLHGNGDGIKIDANKVSGGNTSEITGESSLKIQYNDIYSNTNTASTGATNRGVTNGQTAAVNAKYNWWGQIGGPAPAVTTGSSAMSSPQGNGDKISTNVTYDPWITEQYATVATTGAKRSYGSDAIELGAGWNTMSVPVALKGSANTISEITGLGTYLIASGASQNYEGGYWYDATNSLWVAMDGTTELVPGKGYYVKMKSASRLPVLYFDGSLSLPSISLPAGWNLVGSMFGVDTDDDFGVSDAAANNAGDSALDAASGNVDVADALSSISSNASVVVSPAVPGQRATWSALVTTFNDMIVGEAYWVFMKSSATLAGFQVTPYYFNFDATLP